MTLVNQSAPPGVPGGETLFMRNGIVVSPALKPSHVPGIFIVVHAMATGAGRAVTNTATNRAQTKRVPGVKTLERFRNVE